jgi:hypothetical protein
MSTTYDQRILLFRRVVLVLVTLGSFEPLDELFGRFADLFAGRDVDVFLAGFGAPFLERVFRDQVVLVILEKDGGDLRSQDGPVFADETLGAAEESSFVTFAGDYLAGCISRGSIGSIVGH